jgi:hypothetical protein
MALSGRDRLPAYNRPTSSFRSALDEKRNLANPESSLTFTYRILVGEAQVELYIQIDPPSEPEVEHVFSLSVKAAGISRPLGKPVMMRLVDVDIKALDFACFVFPPKQSIPINSLYSLRVWLRGGSVDHRLFADELWIVQNPDFIGIPNVSTSTLFHTSPEKLVYHASVGTAKLNFIVRRTTLGGGLYDLALEYDANGVGRTLADGMLVRIDQEIDDVSFVIYSVPKASNPPGATHALRFWICAPTEDPFEDPASIRSSAASIQTPRNYICQRLWKCEDFKVGGELDFEAISPNVVIAVQHGPPRNIQAGFPILPVVSEWPGASP